MTEKPQDKIELVYDHDCPICRNYCTRVEIEESAGTLELVDARKDSAVLREVTAAGLDIDKGFVVKRKGKIYYGGEAIAELARLQKKSGLFNRLSRLIFSRNSVAAVLYPLCRRVRDLVLKALGIPYIKNLETRSSAPGQEPRG